MVNRPRRANILESTRVFMKKRYPDEELREYKASFCVRGNQRIDGVDVFDTYAPVVVWIVVRLVLAISMVLNLQTQQVDYSNDFVKYHWSERCFQNFCWVYGNKQSTHFTTVRVCVMSEPS